MRKWSLWNGRDEKMQEFVSQMFYILAQLAAWGINQLGTGPVQYGPRGEIKLIQSIKSQRGSCYPGTDTLCM
jgi:hypothetical protein